MIRSALVFCLFVPTTLALAASMQGADPTSRIENRSFPSIFQAWNAADNLKDEDPWTTVARHDLVFHAPDFFGLKWQGEHQGLAASFETNRLDSSLKLREKLLAINPNLILLAELRYRDAHRSYLPDDHAWWKRLDGKRVVGWEEGGYFLLDYANPEYRRQVARQAKAIMDSGVFDGLMLDWWIDDADRLALVKALRDEIGDQALILVNANDRKTPQTASYVNGYFMECTKSGRAEDWRHIAETLQWAEANLKTPRINCLETWYQTSRNDTANMRATTTLALTLSDGYCLFSDPNPLPTPDHRHNWYEFWNRSLGKAKSRGVQRQDGGVQRNFEKGTAVYNPLGNAPITVQFDKLHKSAAFNQTGMSFAVAAGDGDLFFPTASD